MSMNLFQVDAFADRPFSGNPAAVLLLDRFPEDPWLQDFAAEMNLSETAFVRRRPDQSFDLRWFTPVSEAGLCGHATLASAHVLWEQGWRKPEETIHFETRSGTLRARQSDAGITLDLPADPVSPVRWKASEREAVLRALGVRDSQVRYEGRGKSKILIEIASPASVKELRPDFRALEPLAPKGLIVTSWSGEGCDFVSRYFDPADGIDEDPVTGSAHCTLACYWSEAKGRNEFDAEQVSRRGGRLRVRLEGDRVSLTGQAITVFRGSAAILERRL